MEIYLNTGHFFAVPAAVAEHFLKLASGDQLKVLLYVLCHADTALTAEQVAAQCGVRPEAVEEALAFWQSVNILRNSPDAAPAAVRIAEQSPAAEPVRIPEQPAVEKELIKKCPTSEMTSTRWVINPIEMTKLLAQDHDMLTLIQNSAEVSLKPQMMKCLIWMHEILGLTPDIITMLAAYCVKKRKFNIKVLESIACRWVEQGITTHELAQQDIQNMEDRWNYTGVIMRIFGLEKQPTSEVQEYIDKWRSSKMQYELIRIAYEKTRNRIGDKANISAFKYVDKILERWAVAGIFTVEAARQDEAAFQVAKQKRRFADGQGRKETSVREKKHSSIDPEKVEKLINAF